MLGLFRKKEPPQTTTRRPGKHSVYLSMESHSMLKLASIKAGITMSEMANDIISSHFLREIDEIPKQDDGLNGFSELWIKERALSNVADHEEKYPTFKRGAEYLDFLRKQSPKSQGWWVHQPISLWSKRMRWSTYVETVKPLIDSDLITTKQAAELAGVSVNTINKHARKGNIPRIDGKFRRIDIMARWNK